MTFSALELIGHTPLVDLSDLVPREGVLLFAKLEGNNPGGSVKDRAALSMVERAEARGDLKKGMRIVEATSGNTGIALAMIGSMKGYAVELVMPENATAERILAMRAYGADVILTPAERSMEGAIDEARARVADGNAFMPDQFSNPDNWAAHQDTTAPEIWDQTGGGITHFISAMGTTGTVMGCSRFFKSKDPTIQVVGVQPAEGARIPGIRRWPQAYRPAIFEPDRLDGIEDVTEEESIETAKELARRTGLFVGLSGGGALFACLRLAQTLESGLLVTLLCDRGDRYLTSGIY
jgi:cysteine synthase B